MNMIELFEIVPSFLRVFESFLSFLRVCGV